MTSSFFQPGAACKRSRLPGWLRLVITFGVLVALKYLLPFVGIPAAVQVLILLVVATGFAWLFWWNCSPDRRGIAILIGSLWAAGLIKVFRIYSPVALFVLFASTESQAQRATSTQPRWDQFSAVRCGSDVVKALVGRRVAKGRVVEIEHAHADIALKGLGASGISDSLWFISWGMCGQEFSLLEAGGRVTDAIGFPTHSRRYPGFLGWCTRGQDTIKVVNAVLDNPAWRPPGQPTYVVGDSTMLRAISAWKVDEPSQRFVPIDTAGLRCTRSGMFSVDGGL